MKSIAIIEDDIYIGDMLEEVLKGAGYINNISLVIDAISLVQHVAMAKQPASW